MTEPTPQIPGVRQQQCRVRDADETTLVTTIAVSLAYAEVWAVTRAGGARHIGRTTAGAYAKIDSAGSEYFDDGTVRLWFSAAAPGESGSASRTRYEDFPNAVKPLPVEDTEARRLARAALDQNTNQRNWLERLDARADTLDQQVRVLDERVDALAQG